MRAKGHILCVCQYANRKDSFCLRISTLNRNDLCCRMHSLFLFFIFYSHSVTNPLEYTLFNSQGWRPQVLYLLEAISAMREMHLTYLYYMCHQAPLGWKCHLSCACDGEIQYWCFHVKLCLVILFVSGWFLNWICYDVDQTCIVGSQSQMNQGCAKFRIEELAFTSIPFNSPFLVQKCEFKLNPTSCWLVIWIGLKED